MFFEVVTRKKENVFLNVEHILFVTQYKNGVAIFDILGNDYYMDEPYSSVCSRINEILKTR